MLRQAQSKEQAVTEPSLSRANENQQIITDEALRQFSEFRLIQKQNKSTADLNSVENEGKDQPKSCYPPGSRDPQCFSYKQYVSEYCSHMEGNQHNSKQLMNRFKAAPEKQSQQQSKHKLAIPQFTLEQLSAQDKELTNL